MLSEGSPSYVHFRSEALEVAQTKPQYLGWDRLVEGSAEKKLESKPWLTNRPVGMYPLKQRESSLLGRRSVLATLLGECHATP
jgi:hypothetical protein